MRLVFLSILIVAVAVLLLGVKVLFVKGAKFPMGHDAHAAAHRAAAGRNAKHK